MVGGAGETQPGGQNRPARAIVDLVLLGSAPTYRFMAEDVPFIFPFPKHIVLYSWNFLGNLHFPERNRMERGCRMRHLRIDRG